MGEYLKPCPFCGAKAALREWDWPYVRFQIRCSSCKATSGGRKAVKASAVEVWNTRAETPQPMMAEDVWMNLSAAFGPVLKEAFPTSSASERRAVADTLCDMVKIRGHWFTAAVPQGDAQ